MIELAEQVPPPSIAPVGADADDILGSFARSPTPSRTRFAFNSRASAKHAGSINHLTNRRPAMIEILDTNDSRAVRNKNNVLELYELMINTKRSEEGTAKHVRPRTSSTTR